MKMERKTEILIVGSAIAFLVFSYINYPIQSKEISTTNVATVIEKKVVKHLEPFLFISSTKLEQGDTLFLKISSIASTTSIKGEFKGGELSFWDIGENNFAAVVGIDAKETPGVYNLLVEIGNEKILKDIIIVERNFPVTELVVTDELKEKGYTPRVITEGIINKDNPSVKDVIKVYTPYSYFNKSFIYPLDEITVSGIFGNIRKQGYSALQHLGVDLDAEIATPVYSVNDGVISFAEYLVTYGNTLIIDHGLGIYSLYLHMDSFKVEVGEKINRGEIIGFSGSSGYSILPHLHFSLKVKGASVDPLRFIKTIENSL